MDKVKVFCNMCPISEVCWGDVKPEPSDQGEKTCLLVRFIHGEIKVSMSGYVCPRGSENTGG